MDLFEDEAASGNTPEFSVAEISGAVKRAIEGEFGHVRVRGEVGRVVIARTGHMYFDLKDDRATLACVSWKGQVSKLTHRPEEGMEVIATGKMTTFGPQSKYQLNVEDVAPAGAGALMAMLEKRKAMLQAEGLFAPERKAALPFLPEVIGVVTSPTGAVIRDILHRLRDRFPRKVLVWPVAVQGKDCAPDVAAAIEGFNRMTPGGALPRPDLLIVARGGGSIEDLWGFNEEIVARAAAASEIPLISAVGHETDTTLIDYVSDYRAPTPTAAAERAVPVRLELMAWVESQDGRLGQAMQQALRLREQRLRDIARALPKGDAILAPYRQAFDVNAEKLPVALRTATARKALRLSEASGSLRPSVLQARMRQAARELAQPAARLDPALARYAKDQRRALEALAARIRPDTLARETRRERERLARVSRQFADAARRLEDTRRARLEALDRLRETLGYKETLKRGYAVVRGDGALVTGTKAARAAGELELEFADGKLVIGSGGGGGGGSKPKKPTPKAPPEQGTLL